MAFEPSYENYSIRIDNMGLLLHASGRMREEEIVSIISNCYSMVENMSYANMSVLDNLLAQTEAIYGRYGNYLNINRQQNVPRPNTNNNRVQRRPIRKINNKNKCVRCNVSFIKYERRTTLSCGCKYHKTCKSSANKDCDRCGIKEVREYRENVATEHECSICLDNIKLKDLKTTKCNHHYHKECINTWTRTKRNCPLCRGRI